MQGLSYVSNYDGDTYRALHQPAVVIGACFAFVAVTLSLFLVFRHLRSYTNPHEQKWIVAVIFMVPVYATKSLRITLWLFQNILSLVNPKLSLACDILRSCYEAFALYSFGSYLIACLGGERRVMELLENESRKQLNKPLLEGRSESHSVERRSFIHFFFRPCLLGSDLFTIEKFGLVQYMILKTLCAFLAFILELFGVYGDGEFKWYYGYPYIDVVLNFSQMWALYCLVQLYNVTHEKLKPIKPLAKFISFKAIVFATLWQGVGIALLCAFRVLPDEGKFRTGLQDFLIIEMALAALAHVFVFSAEPYHYIPASEHGKATSKTSKEMMKVKGIHQEKPAMLGKKDVLVEAPGMSIRESVQDIVIQGGQRVVKDVVLTINQAIGPVEKGVTKIQETFHHRADSKDEQESQFKVEDFTTDRAAGK